MPHFVFEHWQVVQSEQGCVQSLVTIEVFFSQRALPCPFYRQRMRYMHESKSLQR